MSSSNAPICMAEEYWRSSQLSVARFFGGINFNGFEYSIIPEDLWMSTADFPRPTSPCWILCRYTDDHYEVVNYSKGIWVTKLDFPVKPNVFFVLQYTFIY